jgi:hypothetical protein
MMGKYRLSLIDKGFARYEGNREWGVAEMRCSFATPNEAKKQRNKIQTKIVVVIAIDDC